MVGFYSFFPKFTVYKVVILIFSSLLACLAQWVSFGGSCYKLITTTETWSNAEAYCMNQQSGVLVKIESTEENDFIKRQFLTGQSDYWIGLSDSVSEGQWKWRDNTELTGFTNWKSGEPNGGNGENCGGIRMGTHDGVSYDGEWHDDICWEVKGYICEK